MWHCGRKLKTIVRKTCIQHNTKMGRWFFLYLNHHLLFVSLIKKHLFSAKIIFFLEYCSMYCSYSIDSGEIKTTIKHKKTNVILILMTERTNTHIFVLETTTMQWSKRLWIFVQASNYWLCKGFTHLNKHGRKKCVQCGTKNDYWGEVGVSFYR